MCSGSEAGSCLRFIYSYITQLKAQGPSRTCNESQEEEKSLTVHAPLAHPEMAGVITLPPGAAYEGACAGFGVKLRDAS